MMQSLRRFATSISPFRARGQLLARENSEMRAKLVQVRRAAGMTQADVAEMLGVTRQAINKIERYDADPKLSTLERYANAVGALVFHRVEVDNGQAVRLVSSATWVSSRVSAPRHVVTHSPSRTIHGWTATPTTMPDHVDALLPAGLGVAP